MTLDPRCPSCGRVNTADASQCSQCNFPLHEGAPTGPTPAGGPPADERPAPPPEISMQRIRPIRPRRPGGPQQALQTQLWLLFGVLAVGALLWTAVKGYQKNNAPQAVEGATPEQQQNADLARKAVEKDSTNVNAQVALGNVLYDTANWTEAIVHYRSALRMDPRRVTTIVDLGVCYYNLSDAESAVSLFKQALALDPRQPVALFNLGIVAENRKQPDEAMKYYHQAMQSNPAPDVAQGITEALKRVMAQTGKAAPAIGGAAGGMPPGGMPPSGK